MTENKVEGLVSPSDIAELTGFTRGAVSNWRRRANDFPEPIAGTEANPLFGREDVLAWLEANGKPVKADRGENAAWAALNVLRGNLDMGEAAMLILTLACARKLAEREGGSSFVTRWRGAVAAGVGSTDAWGLLRDAYQSLDPRGELISFQSGHQFVPPLGVDQIVDVLGSIGVPDLAHATDVVLERLARSQGKMGADAGFAGSRISALLSSLSAGADNGTLYDPACGRGIALLQAVDSGVKPRRIVGHDINREALLVARQRAFLRDVEVELTLGDVLAHDPAPDLKAEVVIAEPPFGVSFRAPEALFDERYHYGQPPRSSADWAWTQHAVAHVNERGRAYVVLTSGSLDRSSERAIRMGLVGAGCLETVIGLPGKMLPHVSVPLALIVLRRPRDHGADSGVLFIDASEQSDPERKVAQWLSGSAALADVPHVTVTAAELLAKDARLEPRLWLPAVVRDAGEIVSSFSDAWTEVLHTSHEIKERMSAPSVFKLTRPHVATVDELTSQAIIKVWGSGRQEDGYADMGFPKALLKRVATASDVRDGTLHSAPIAVVPGSELDKPHLTDAGDLLVTTWNEVRARVDVAGGHLPGTGVHRVKIRDSSVLTPEYLAITLMGTWNKRFLGGSTIQRARLNDLEIPLVPIAEQQRVVSAIQGIEQLERQAARLSDSASTVRGAYLDALRYNVDLTRTKTGGTAE